MIYITDMRLAVRFLRRGTAENVFAVRPPALPQQVSGVRREYAVSLELDHAQGLDWWVQSELDCGVQSGVSLPQG
jgi:hypothetical protein